MITVVEIHAGEESIVETYDNLFEAIGNTLTMGWEGTPDRLLTTTLEMRTDSGSVVGRIHYRTGLIAREYPVLGLTVCGRTEFYTREPFGTTYRAERI